MPAIPAVKEAELDVAHIISTSYPRRGKALEETPAARITTTAKRSSMILFYMHDMRDAT